ncbi:hypothetical protein [Stenotrophomonas oahuensis]|uniref:Uncharacterized protein n=1 Tax=Stenotrophomonas oahuensis TaxID=3003271 RepID=A0ABY9YJ87_9GAMM|nr:hypothetical protein [Stenotrophomonas sp. A5586]WNH50923.1 hypothetical protein PDM29_11025 [Stenotrophomonas sp. A5586]
MDLLRIAVRIQHLHPIDGLRALMQGRIKTDDSLETAVAKKRYNTFLSSNSIGELQRIANAQFKLSTYNKSDGTAAQQLTALRSSGFKGFQSAGRELEYVENLALQTRGKHARAELQWLITDFQRQAASGVGYWQSRLEQAKSDGNRTEMELAATWLGGMTLRNVLAELAVSAETPPKMHAWGPSGVDSQTTPLETPRMKITEAFKAAADTHGLKDSQLKELEDWAVATLALPERSASKHAIYVDGKFPPLSPATEGTKLLLAQSELSEVLNAVAAPPAKPADAPLLCLLADLQSRVSDTLIHWSNQRDQLAKEQERVPTLERAAEIERIENLIGATSRGTDLDDVSEAGSDVSYSSVDSFGTEPPRRKSSINLLDDESTGDVDDLFDSSSSIFWESDTGSESARYDQSSLAGFDLPFTKLPTAGGVYFGDSGRIINTRKMTLEEAFATKLLNESVSTTTIDKLDIIFERRYGITLTTSGMPRFELSSFANPFREGLRRPHEGLDDLAAISRRLDQMRPSQAQDDLKQALALYQTHLTEAGNWWRAEAKRLAENPPPAVRTDLLEMHALKLDVAMAWLGHGDA